MGDHATLQQLVQRQCQDYPQLTQLLRVAYRSLGLDLTPRFPRLYSEYSEAAFARALGLDSPVRTVCIVLVDGLGWELLQAAKAHLPFLRGRLANAIEGRTVLPSTTATALTSFSTGEPPAYTNMFGYSVATKTGTANLINFQGLGEDPAAWQPVQPLFQVARDQGVESTVITSARFKNSGLTNAAFRGTNFIAAEKLGTRVEAALQHLQQGSGLTYLYWSELDHVGHVKGWQSLDWTDELEHVDARLRRLVENCPADAAIILTADHGMVDVATQQRIDLAQNPELALGVEKIAGEGRCVQLHTQPGEVENVLARWKQMLGDSILTCTDPQVVYNGPVSSRFQADAMVFSLQNQVIVDSRTQPAAAVNLVGVHGSVTSAETAIPFLRLN